MASMLERIVSCSQRCSCGVGLGTKGTKDIGSSKARTLTLGMIGVPTAADASASGTETNSHEHRAHWSDDLHVVSARAIGILRPVRRSRLVG